MLPIAIDANGGDEAPDAIVAGARAARDELGVEVVLVGTPDIAELAGDLPLIESMAWLDQPGDAVVLVPDRHGKGTNVISTPTPGFRFAYGPDSFARHVAEVERLGLELCVVRDPAMGWDIDVPSDLSAIDGSVRGPAPSR